MRHSATRSLLERDDVIIVASVSCIYGIGSVETYSAMIFDLKKGQSVDQREIVRKLVALQYKRNDAAVPARQLPRQGRYAGDLPVALRGFGVASVVLRRRHRGDCRVRSADRAEGRDAQLDPHLCQFALRDARADHEAGDRGDPPRIERTAQGDGGGGQAARAPAAGTAHQFRPRDDRPRPAAATASRTTAAS